MASDTQTTGHPLTIGEAAVYLRVSRRTVTRLIADGDLPTIRIRNVVRLGQADLDAYLVRQRTVPVVRTSTASDRASAQPTQRDRPTVKAHSATNAKGTSPITMALRGP